MRALPLAALAAFVATLLLPAAAGYPQPAFYFLKSGCSVDEVEGQCPVPDATVPSVPPLPPPAPPVPAVGVPKLVFVDGVLDPYNFLAPNPPNSTEPDLKPVYTASESVVPVRFVTPADHVHPGRLKGYFIVGVFTGESAVPNGNLTATLYEILEDGTEVALLNASVAVDLNTSKAPDPTTLVPPNSTLPPGNPDPTALVIYEVAKVLPLVLQPPQVYLLGPVDLNVSNTSRLAIGFHLEQGSSQSPQPPGSATISFNATLNPSFVYAPWYAPDPPRSSSTRTFGSTRTFSSTRTGTFSSTQDGDDDDRKGKGNGIPGFEMTLAVSLVAVAALVARRRL